MGSAWRGRSRKLSRSGNASCGSNCRKKVLPVKDGARENHEVVDFLAKHHRAH